MAYNARVVPYIHVLGSRMGFPQAGNKSQGGGVHIPLDFY